MSALLLEKYRQASPPPSNPPRVTKIENALFVKGYSGWLPNQGIAPEDAYSRQRKQVSSPSARFPCRSVARIEVWYDRGEPLHGTAFLVSEKHLLTAGHLIHRKDRGGWCKRAYVWLGADGDESSPLMAVPHMGNEAWTKDEDRQHDYAVLRLAGDVKEKTAEIGWWGLASLPDAALKGSDLYLLGYPGGSRLQFAMAGTVDSLSPLELHCNYDDEKGASGSPVYLKVGSDRYAVGIHVGYHQIGREEFRRAMRLNDGRLKQLVEWIGK